jgi:hypothetical protein
VNELVAHAVGVESVFSMMGATKTKNRHSMKISTLGVFKTPETCPRSVQK